MRSMFLLGSVAVLALAGCGLISSPPIANPFQLDGKSTAIPLVAAQATGNATVNATFDDLTLTLPTGPSGFNYTLAIKSVSFSGAGCPSSIPSPINVTLSANLTVSDGSGASARNSSATASNVQFQITNTSGSLAVGNLNNPTLSFSNIATLIQILQTGGLNTAALQASVTTSSTPDLGNCTLNLTWAGGEGVLKF